MKGVLIVDDKATVLARTLRRSALVRSCYDIDALELKWSAGIADELGEALEQRRAEGWEYAFALLGLRFGEPEGYDLSGYHLISVLKRFYPRLPIIVYSRHDDMGHLARAFRYGASWFVRKNEIENLPQVIASLKKRRSWVDEWKTICAAGAVEFKFDECSQKEAFIASFDDARRYLTYKCLERLPGRVIRIRPMGGGFSTSATFKAVKESGGVVLQVPLIVKIDNRSRMTMEYERYSRFIRPYIPNDAGRVESAERVIDEGHAAIVYTFAGTQNGKRHLTDMKSMMIEDFISARRCDFRKYRTSLDQLFDEILPRIHRVSPNIETDGMPGGSSYPNPDFWELPPEDMLGNWLNRIRINLEDEFYDPEVAEAVADLREMVASDGARKRFKCPIGIIHGDLNLANVMVETYKDAKRRNNIADAWLIDFGLTRRDYVAHDFSVLFTSVLSLWFRKEGLSRPHLDRLMKNYDRIMEGSLTGRCLRLDADVRNDSRIMFVVQILRRVRKAAIATGLSPDMYLLSVTMGLLVCHRIQLQFEHNEESARGMLRGAKLALGLLKKRKR